MTIVELMVALASGLIVVVAALTLLVSAKAGYNLEDDATRMNDTARYVVETVSRAVKQSAYRNYDPDDGPILADTDAGFGANISGLDAVTFKAGTAAIESPLTSSVNGSDVLVVRFFGIGTDAGDGSMANCAGFSVGAPDSGSDAASQRGWSIFYVATDATGEPELRCKYKGKSGWTSDAIARGVESFQVLYGVDTDRDGLPNKFLNASAIDAIESATPVNEMNALKNVNALDNGTNPPSQTMWAKVVVVKVAVLIRGSQDNRGDLSATPLDLFGTGYAEAQVDSDPGTRIKEANLPAAVRSRMRKIFRFDIQLRHPTVSHST